MLCKAGGKECKHWFENKTTKLLIYTSESEVGIPTSELIDIKKGNSSKFEQGSWIHPDLGIHLAQWISPSFALQVSRCTREILLFGKVELGQEKSNKELENKFQEQIKLLTQEKQQAIEEKEQVIIEKETIARRFTSLTHNHNKMLKRRRRGVGNVVYIISHLAFTRQLQSKVLYLYNINTKLK
jgi:hypothetical protein